MAYNISSKGCIQKADLQYIFIVFDKMANHSVVSSVVFLWVLCGVVAQPEKEARKGVLVSISIWQAPDTLACLISLVLLSYYGPLQFPPGFWIFVVRYVARHPLFVAFGLFLHTTVWNLGLFHAVGLGQLPPVFHGEGDDGLPGRGCNVLAIGNEFDRGSVFPHGQFCLSVLDQKRRVEQVLNSLRKGFGIEQELHHVDLAHSFAFGFTAC